MPRFETSVSADGELFNAVCTDNALGAECFRSTGWETEERAAARIREHLVEHATGEPAREAGAFHLGLSQEEYEEKVKEWESYNTVVVPDEGGADA